MLLGVFAALAVLGLVGLVLALRASARAQRSAPRRAPAAGDSSRGPGATAAPPDPTAPGDAPASDRSRGDGDGPAVDRGGAVGALHRLGVGARVEADQRTWRVLGTTAARDGSWTAWHLEEQGQRGLLLVEADDPDHVVVGVGAEDVAAIDPEVAPLLWRHLEWEAVGVDEGAVRATGSRQRWRREEPLPAAAIVSRRRFRNPELVRRRLTFLRVAVDDGDPAAVEAPAIQRLSGGDVGAWDAWIGDLLPVRQVDVFTAIAPAGGDAAPA